MMLTACEKTSNVTLEAEDIDMADDDAVSEAVFDDIFNSVDNATQYLDSYKGAETKGDIVVLADSCPTVTVEFTDETVRVVTIDFGEGCQGLWDQTRSGRIIITVDGRRRVAGSTRTVTFDDYYFNGIKIEGTKFTGNMGKNDNGNFVFSSGLSDGRLIFPNDTVVSKEFEREREWIAGFDTRTPWDDECLITGSASGTTWKGIKYENTIISALHWKRACKFFVSGVVEIVRSGGEPVTLDYGDGECDAVATLRRGDELKEITLRYKHRKIMNQ